MCVSVEYAPWIPSCPSASCRHKSQSFKSLSWWVMCSVFSVRGVKATLHTSVTISLSPSLSISLCPPSVAPAAEISLSLSLSLPPVSSPSASQPPLPSRPFCLVVIPSPLLNPLYVFPTSLSLTLSLSNHPIPLATSASPLPSEKYSRAFVLDLKRDQRHTDRSYDFPLGFPRWSLDYIYIHICFQSIYL